MHKKDKNSKKESLDRLRQFLEQAKLNLRLANENNDKCEIKYWSKQVRLQENVIKRIESLRS